MVSGRLATAKCRRFCGHGSRSLRETRKSLIIRGDFGIFKILKDVNRVL